MLLHVTVWLFELCGLVATQHPFVWGSRCAIVPVCLVIVGMSMDQVVSVEVRESGCDRDGEAEFVLWLATDKAHDEMSAREVVTQIRELPLPSQQLLQSLARSVLTD